MADRIRRLAQPVPGDGSDAGAVRQRLRSLSAAAYVFGLASSSIGTERAGLGPLCGSRRGEHRQFVADGAGCCRRASLGAVERYSAWPILETALHKAVLFLGAGLASTLSA